jgi:hypothetical protein
VTDEWLTAVQRSALKRALVDDVDARRYFALAGTLDFARQSTGTGADSTPASRSKPQLGPNGVTAADGVLPAALLSLAVVPLFDETTPPASPTASPWEPAHDGTRPAVRRGARLALRWFDVSAERVAASAGLPEVVFTPSDD